MWSIINKKTGEVWRGSFKIWRDAYTSLYEVCYYSNYDTDNFLIKWSDES